MELLYTCWRLKNAANEYADLLREGNEKDAAEELRKIRKLVSRFGQEVKDGRMDSAFFEGELDAKSGERKVLYPWQELVPARTKQ